jgi:hypothetical protein
MRLAVGTVLFFLGSAQLSWGQTNGSANLVSGDSSAYTVAKQLRRLRCQPSTGSSCLPLRVHAV